MVADENIRIVEDFAQYDAGKRPVPWPETRPSHGVHDIENCKLRAGLSMIENLDHFGLGRRTNPEKRH